jgi:hypothetical protein
MPIISADTGITNMKRRALTRAQVREVDRIATEQYAIPGIVLMENAGIGATAVIDAVAPRMKKMDEKGDRHKLLRLICSQITLCLSPIRLIRPRLLRGATKLKLFPNRDLNEGVPGNGVIPVMRRPKTA